MTVPGLQPPSSLRYRAVLLLRALRTLADVEARARRTAPVELCARYGVTFGGFAPPPPQPRQSLTWDIACIWWAVETVLALWPWARDRPCLRRSLVLGRQLRDHDPTLCLEVTSLAPFTAHAWLLVSGHRLDMGPAGPLVGRLTPDRVDR